VFFTLIIIWFSLTCRAGPNSEVSLEIQISLQNIKQSSSKLTWLCCQFFYFSFLFGELPGKACLVATIMQLVNVMKRWPVEETFLFQHFKRGLYNWPINITYTDMRFLLYLQNNI
jgi:hypothetical protein